MALVHNVMIHGYNSIYLQAPRIISKDVPDFVQYCLSWYEVVRGHHHSEEQLLFPLIEEGTGVKGIMDDDVKEHRKRSASCAVLTSALRPFVKLADSVPARAVLRRPPEGQGIP